MKTVPPLNDLFNMAGLNLPSYLKGEDQKAASEKIEEAKKVDDIEEVKKEDK
jgi:flotillin